MDDLNDAINSQRDLLDSLQKRIDGSTPFIDFDKLNLGTFMSRYYLTNCLDKKWLNPANPEVKRLVVGWAKDYPEFLSRCLRHEWLNILDPEVKKLALNHVYDAPHRYTLHFLLEGWITVEDPKVKDLIILTLNEGNSNIYLDRGWLTQEEIDSILEQR